ncbi:hypothetical protein EDD22DRAFT_853026 [Suillus occidentalis]|nr:hypothetical protein EDD22DRAFT_853026 [Suillus occidentalis]
MAQGRAIRRVVSLFDNIEDLVTENDRRLEDDSDQDSTIGQDRLQMGSVELEYEDYIHMLKMCSRRRHVKAQGSQSPIGSIATSSQILQVDSDDKHCRGFTNDACGQLLCPAELDWSSPTVKAGIRDRSEGYIVTDLSFPAYLYDKYTADPNDLEAGLFKGKILIQGYKAVFMSPSSAKDTEGDGDGADVIQNNRRARRTFAGIKVKKHVAQIIRMRKVTPRSIAYIACQVRFALSSVTSWRSVDGDFDYVQFWQTIVDFFERAPGREARRRTDRLLEWWTRKVFGRNHRDELTDAAKENMSVNALARQRAQRDDAAFDSS